jgi:hypothetical protein
MPNKDLIIPGDVESTSNKATTPLYTPHAATWTDTQYPTALELFNLQASIKDKIDDLHPVGSTLCMGSNINPACFYGGEWQLIDKSFSTRSINITADNWIPTNSTLYTDSYFYNQNKVYLYDKTAVISISLRNVAMTGDNTYELGKLNLISLNLHPFTYFGHVSGSTQGDGTQARICYTFTDAGAITCYDALYAGANSTHRADADVIVFTMRTTYTPTQMSDAYCNKFVFKRIS